MAVNASLEAEPIPWSICLHMKYGQAIKELHKNLNLQWLNGFIDGDCMDLAGGIPPSWGNYSDLMVIDISNNQLSGPLSSAWSNLNNMRYLNMSANQFTGDIPSAWRQSSGNNATVDEGMTNLQYLWVPTLGHHCQLHTVTTASYITGFWRQHI